MKIRKKHKKTKIKKKTNIELMLSFHEIKIFTCFLFILFISSLGYFSRWNLAAAKITNNIKLK